MKYLEPITSAQTERFFYYKKTRGSFFVILSESEESLIR
jgi:hypothetical protein